jgi:hypothetical protein
MRCIQEADATTWAVSASAVGYSAWPESGDHLGRPGFLLRNDASEALIGRSTACATRAAIAPGEEDVIGPREHGPVVHFGVVMVVQVMVAKEPERRAQAKKPIRFQAVNRPMDTGPQVCVTKAPRQQSRGGNDNRRNRSDSDSPHAQHEERRAGQQHTVSQRHVDQFMVIRSPMMGSVGFQLP